MREVFFPHDDVCIVALGRPGRSESIAAGRYEISVVAGSAVRKAAEIGFEDDGGGAAEGGDARLDAALLVVALDHLRAEGAAGGRARRARAIRHIEAALDLLYRDEGD